MHHLNAIACMVINGASVIRMLFQNGPTRFKTAKMSEASRAVQKILSRLLWFPCIAKFFRWRENLENDRCRCCDQNRPQIIKIGISLAIFRLFEALAVDASPRLSVPPVLCPRHQAVVADVGNFFRNSNNFFGVAGGCFPLLCCFVLIPLLCLL